MFTYKLRNDAWRKFRYLCLIAIITISYIHGPDILIGKILAVVLNSLIIYQIIINYQRHRYGLMLVFFFMLTYTFVSVGYYFMNQHISVRIEAENQNTVFYVNLYTTIFFGTLSFFLKSSDKKHIFSKSMPFVGSMKSDILWFLCLCFAVFCIVKGKSGQSIFSSGSYGETMHTLEVSSTFGYGILPIVVALFFSDTKIKLKATFFISGFYVLKDISFGGRIDSIMLLLALFMMYFRFVLSRKTIMTLAVIGFVFASLWEIYRNFANDSIWLILYRKDEIGLSLTTGNSSDVYYASMRIIYLIEKGVLSIYDRIEAAIYFCVSTIVPYNKLPPLANLSSYYQSTYSSGGGGLVPIFIFAMFSLPGVIFSGAFVGLNFRRLVTGRFSKYSYIYSILLVATTPRWFAYYPITMIKYCVYGIVLLCIMEMLCKVPILWRGQEFHKRECNN